MAFRQLQLNSVGIIAEHEWSRDVNLVRDSIDSSVARRAIAIMCESPTDDGKVVSSFVEWVKQHHCGNDTLMSRSHAPLEELQPNPFPCL